MRVRRFILLILLTFLIASGTLGQSTPAEGVQENSAQLLDLERLSFLSDLRSLDEQGLGLAPLSRALVKAEIADAAWPLDREWAKTLLVKAYELTFPDDDEREKLRNKKVGSRPPLPLSVDRARGSVRNRVMRIAAREKAFADELIHLGLEQLGAFDTQKTYASLASSAWHEHDMDAAGEYLRRAIEIDPSQIAAGFLLADIAKSDRGAADRLIVGYLNRLRDFPLSLASGNISRIYLIVDKLVFPPVGAAPPSPDVMRAYVSYVIQSFGDLEIREPGSLTGYRAFLLRAWLPLRQYAPELTAEFMALEQHSRGSNDQASLPTEGTQSTSDKDDYEKRLRDASESDQPDEMIINRAINRGDFARARKLIDKLSDGPEKTQLLETVNAREALHLLKKGDLVEAKQLAERLQQARFIQQVYPELIGKCVRDKDQICATGLMLQAIKRLKTAEATPLKPPADIPTSIIATSAEFDPILDGIAKLTLAVFPISPKTSFLGLGETVAAANVSQVETGQGRPGFDFSIFKKLAPKDESRVRQAAESFTDPLRRLVSLAAMYQWKGTDLNERMTKSRVQRKNNQAK